MILIFGGAYQGKLEYAKEHFDIKSIFDCAPEGGRGEAADGTTGLRGNAGREPDFSADAVCNIDRFVLQCAREGKEAADFFKENREKWQQDAQTGIGEKVFVVTDVSQGIVPIDATQRAFREMNGRLMLYLAKEARQVIRVFCGIGKPVKDENAGENHQGR